MSKSAAEPPNSDRPYDPEHNTVIAFPERSAPPAPTAASAPEEGATTTPPEPPKRRRAAAKSSSPRGPRRGRTRKASDGSSEAVHYRLENSWGWIEGAGIHVSGVQSVLFFWKRLGWKGLLAVLLVAGYPLGQYSLLSYVTNSTVPRLAGDFGVTFDAKDWSYHPLSLKTVARDVQIRPKHDPRAQPIFTAGEVEFQGSLGSTLTGLRDLLIEWRGFHTFNEVTLKHATIHLERSATGHLNWADYSDVIPQKRREEFLAGLYQINTVIFDDVRVNYVEHVRGNSGGGIIQTVQANLFVDGINGAISDITQADPGNSLPTRVRFAGRLADGLVELTGRLGFVSSPQQPQGSSTPPGQPPEYRRASHQEAGAQEGPYYDITVALNNIGAAAFARAMPPTRIMATSGTLSGKVALRHAEPPCVADAAMHEVRFAPNPHLVPVRAEYDELQRLLKDRVVSKPYRACDPLSPEHDRRPVPTDAPTNTPRYAPNEPTQRARANGAAAFVAAFNEQANEDAPRAVKSAVAQDSQNLTGTVMSSSFEEVVASSVDEAVTGAVNDATGKINKRVGNTLSKRLGISVLPASNKVQPQSAAPQEAGNPVAKGVKGIGRGIKRLFGGGDDGKKDEKKKDEKKKPGT